jgi:hypothetical protein
MVFINEEEVSPRDVKPDEWGKEDRVVRKKYELKLVQKFDKSAHSLNICVLIGSSLFVKPISVLHMYRSKINVARECWFLIDCVWLNAWSTFVNTEDGDPPGPLSSKDLLDKHGVPLAGLKACVDYRGVSAVVYFILKQLHGSDGSPDITRYL